LTSEGWIKKRETRDFYDQTANSYDGLYREEQMEKYELALRLIKAPCYGKILDAGCGTGLLEEYLLSVKGEGYLLFGVDISRGLLKIAREKLRSRQNVFLICGDSDHMPFCEGLFELCTAFTLIQNLPHPHVALEELRRVSVEEATILVTYLKEKLSLEEFKLLLGQAELAGDVLESPKLKEYVSICRFKPKNKERR